LSVHGEQAVGELQPLRAVAVVDPVAAGEVRLVDGAVGALEVLDRLAEEPLDLGVGGLLGVEAEGELRLVERLLEDDLARLVGDGEPAPRLEDLPDAEQVPALLASALAFMSTRFWPNTQ
jgi:hypothetical protein